MPLSISLLNPSLSVLLRQPFQRRTHIHILLSLLPVTHPIQKLVAIRPLQILKRKLDPQVTLPCSFEHGSRKSMRNNLHQINPNQKTVPELVIVQAKWAILFFKRNSCG